MAIYYVDLVSGNDSNGGTDPLLPKLTVASAVTAASANDEIRIAKTAAPTVISGCTFGFTLGSATITTSADMRGSLAVGDVIGKTTAQGNGYQTETYYRIHAITASAITLLYGFGGTTENVTSINKLSFTTATINISKILTCSGGWNFSGTPIRDGETWLTSSSTTSVTGVLSATISYLNMAMIAGATWRGNCNYQYCTLTYTGYNISSNGFQVDIGSNLSNCTVTSGAHGCYGGATSTISNCLFVNAGCGINNVSGTSSNCLAKCCVTAFSTAANHTLINCSATRCITGFVSVNNASSVLISCSATACSNGFNTIFFMDGCTSTSCTSSGVVMDGGSYSHPGIIRNHVSLNDARAFYFDRLGGTLINCRITTPTTWGISTTLGVSTITVIGCSIDAPSISKAYQRVSGNNYSIPQYYLQNSFGVTGTVYANTTVLEDSTTTPHSLQIIFYGTSGLQFSPIRVASLWAKQSIALTITLQVWAPSGTFTGTVVPSLTLNGATLITLPTITTITSSIQTLTFSVTQAMMTADGMLEILVVPNGNNTPINFGNLTVVKA